MSRGNAILAELLRLADNIPEVFHDKSATYQKYAPILIDFRYFQSAEFFDNKIDSTPELFELDDEFKESHREILKRFYLLFESIYKYANDFITYFDELEQGFFIQMNLETVLMNVDGKQLVAEALYLYGTMLLLMDELIPGPIRERMLISHLRVQGASEIELIDEVSKLFRATGYVPGSKDLESAWLAPGARAPKSSSRGQPAVLIPSGYPASLFARIPMPKDVVHMLIGRLRTDDIYSQIIAYPQPDHRSTALASQASMIYVILYFMPDVLMKQQSTMREIVDKHFADNWVISFFLGYTVDLSLVWSVYPAAAAAIANTAEADNARMYYAKYWEKVPSLLQGLDGYLTEGVLHREYILDRASHLLTAVRELNVTIRWLMLQSLTSNSRLRPITNNGFDKNRLLLLILKTAQFEYVLKNIFQDLLTKKEDSWNTCKAEAVSHMKELSEYFSGEKALTRVARNESLQKWFDSIGTKVAGLDYHDSTLAGRKIQHLITALLEVEQFHQIESSLQVKQFLEDSRKLLQSMIRIVNIKDQYLIIMSIVSDMAYGWQAIDLYQSSMHSLIKADPSTIVMIRSTFLKLSSIMDLPLIRIRQAASSDLVSVAHYYSGELVAFVRRVLEIIPRSMFSILSQIIDLQTTKLRELPTRVDKSELRDLAQLEQRYHLAKLTHDVSVFTEGILAMETTIVGVIPVDPKQILEDGIRKQLVQSIASSMDRALIFDLPGDKKAASLTPTQRLERFDAQLRNVAVQLDGLKRSFQYIQDYVNIYGLKIWQEEFSRIISYNVEQECNSFLKKKIFSWQSSFQSDAIPIPEFPSPDPKCINFIGRLANQLLLHTDGHQTIYLDAMSAWYSRSGHELVGIRTFDLLQASVGVFGVSGLDRLFCFKIVRELQHFVRQVSYALEPPQLKPRRGELASASNSTVLKNYQRDLALAKQFVKELQNVHDSLTPVTTIPISIQKLYAGAIQRIAPLVPLFLATVMSVGQMQILRRQIANVLNFA
ncbi:MAG: WASH complex subunit 5, partial [archaeon]|nr:WASH complex subunit 5 [archaeon]